MRFSAHDRAEVLAGAITLGEATDEERLEYRRHVSECGTCLRALGGEHELHRMHDTVRQAASDEVWAPDVRGPLMDRLNTAPRRIARYGLGFLGVALVVSLIGHFVVGSTLAHPWSDPPVLDITPFKVTLERKSTRDAKTPSPAPRLLVEHNVFHLTGAGPDSSKLSAAKSSKPVTTRQVVTMAPASAAQSARAQLAAGARAAAANVPAWRSAIPPRRQPYVASASIAGLAHAESLTIAPVYSTREAEPEGGDTAIQPRPPAIAAQEGAEGTTAFEVTIDENGNPTKCAIAMPSGYPVLDEATCRAAMKIHYRPKTLNGKPVVGVYRDAFTFRPPDQGVRPL
ncbi:MAG: hypothetical protein NVS9B12_00140 [Vulcanimicrobiaceae bacterium]